MKRPGRFEAYGMLALVAVHVVLGGWLLIVPDHLAFTMSQLTVLAHVALGVVALPLAVVWSMRHVRQSERRARRTMPARFARWGLVVSVALALASGVPAIWSSQGMPTAQSHAVVGAAVVLFLVLHLIIERRRLIGFAVLGGVGLLSALLVTARVVVRGDSITPASPAFSYEVRPTALYDEAAWCGSCHPKNYEEWSRSTHGRAMDLPLFREDFEHRSNAHHVDLVAVGKAAHAEPGSPLLYELPAVPEQCPMCHSPASFFGDDPTPPLEAKGSPSDGVTCSFCHTLRGIRTVPEADQEVRKFIDRVQRGEAALEDSISPGMFQAVPMYISAPETVRRYLGQGSSNPVARMIGDYLIRWRPQMHRNDYHSPFLNTSQACQGCHGVSFDAPETPHKTYPDWETSDYNTEDERTRVECQDCHMVRELTGQPVREPGRLVPWGPVRAQQRSHLFLGGNAAANLQFDDPETAERQRELARQALQLSLDSATLEDRRVVARVTLRNRHIGHGFPGMETVQRFGFVRIAAFDANDGLIAESPKPEMNALESNQVGGTAVLFRYVDPRTLRVAYDTTIPSHESRSYEVFVDLPAAAPPVARVEVRVGHNFDPEPFLTASRSFGEEVVQRPPDAPDGA